MAGTNIRGIASGGGCDTGQWCRLGIDSDFTVAASLNWAVRWDHTFNPYPAWYEVTDSSLGGTNNAINILQNGVYALNYELYADTGTQPTNRGFYVSMNGVNWTNDSGIQYWPSHEVVNYDVPSYAFAGTFVFRSGAAYLPVALAICTANDADNDVGFIGDDANVTYMEVVRLSCEDLVGNPYLYD